MKDWDSDIAANGRALGKWVEMRYNALRARKSVAERVERDAGAGGGQHAGK